MLLTGELFEYPRSTRLIFYFGVVFGSVIFLASIYSLVSQSLSVHTLVWFVGLFVGLGMAGGAIVELYNHHSVLINEEGICLLRSLRRQQIRWADIDRIFYTHSEGLRALNRFLSFYVTSRRGDIIKVSQAIDRFQELEARLLQ